MVVDEESEQKCKHHWTFYDDKCTQCGMTFDDYRRQVYNFTNNYKCTCGAEKAGFDSHAHYCDKERIK